MDQETQVVDTDKKEKDKYQNGNTIYHKPKN